MSNSWFLRVGAGWFARCGCGEVIFEPPSLPWLRRPVSPCPRCGADRWMDAGSFVYDRQVRYWRAFEWDLEYESPEPLHWRAFAIVRLPLVRGFVTEPKIEPLVLMEMEFCQCGELKVSARRETVLARQTLEGGRPSDHLEPRVRRSLERLLLGLLRNHPSLKWLAEDRRFAEMDHSEALKAYLFYYCHEALREGEFFFWKSREELESLYATGIGLVDALMWVLDGRREKRVRRAFFSAYEAAMGHRYYDPLPDLLFCRTVKDRNYLERLIALPYEVKSTMFREMSREEGEHLLVFLLTRHGEGGVVRFFTSLDAWLSGMYYVEDIGRMIRQLGPDPRWLDLYRPRSCDVREIHRELSRLVALRQDRLGPIPFEYRPREVQSCGTLEGLEFRLPRNGLELRNWATKLGNCLASYTESIERGQSVIFGVFRSGELVYALEIREQRIRQLSGRFNTPVPEEDREIIEKWFYRYIKN